MCGASLFPPAQRDGWWLNGQTVRGSQRISSWERAHSSHVGQRKCAWKGAISHGDCDLKAGTWHGSTIVWSLQPDAGETGVARFYKPAYQDEQQSCALMMRQGLQAQDRGNLRHSPAFPCAGHHLAIPSPSTWPFRLVNSPVSCISGSGGRHKSGRHRAAHVGGI